MVKSRFLSIVILFCVPLVSASVDRTGVKAQSVSAPAVRRQQALVKQINQKALRFYRAFIRQSIRTTATVDCDLNDMLEDLLLAVDGLNDPRYRPHNLVIVIQIASDIEQELLWAPISFPLVTAWGRLHADLDRLAKMNGIKWSEPAIPDGLIAARARWSGPPHPTVPNRSYSDG